MRLKDIKTLIINSTKKNETFPLIQLAELQALTTVNLEMDRDTNDYYYKVNINDLVDKVFKPEIILDNGWKLSDDGNYMLLIL